MMTILRHVQFDSVSTPNTRIALNTRLHQPPTIYTLGGGEKKADQAGRPIVPRSLWKRTGFFVITPISNADHFYGHQLRHVCAVRNVLGRRTLHLCPSPPQSLDCDSVGEDKQEEHCGRTCVTQAASIGRCTPSGRVGAGLRDCTLGSWKQDALLWGIPLRPLHPGPSLCRANL